MLRGGSCCGGGSQCRQGRWAGSLPAPSPSGALAVLGSASPASDCWNSFSRVLLMGKRSLVSISFFSFLLSGCRCWAGVRSPCPVPPLEHWQWPAVLRPHSLGLCWEQLEMGFSHFNDLAVNYHSNVFHLFHCSLYTPATVILKIK